MNRNSTSEARVRPLRERLRAETVRAILAAAEEVFASRGIRGAKVEEIAQRAGVAVGTVYNHFEDRDAVLSALIELRRAELAKKLDLADAGAPFEAQLRQFVGTVFEHFEEKREFLAILLEGDAANIARPSEGLTVLRKHAETLVRRGLTQKALRAAHADLFPSMLFGAVRASLVHELHHPGAFKFGERADAVVDFFLRGAGAESGGGASAGAGAASRPGASK
jgi:AcrR family transcriptional regulator